MQCVGELVDEPGEILFVSWVDLLPINYDARSLRVTQHRKHIFDKAILPFRRPVREILNGLGLPGVTHQIR